MKEHEQKTQKTFEQQLQEIEIGARARAGALRWFSWTTYLLVSLSLAVGGNAFYLAAITGVGIAFFPPLVLLAAVAVGGIAGFIGYKLNKISAQNKLKKQLEDSTEKKPAPTEGVAKLERVSKNAAWRWFLRSMLIVIGLWIGAGFPLILLGLGFLCSLCVAKIGEEIIKSTEEASKNKLKLAQLNAVKIRSKLSVAQTVINQYSVDKTSQLPESQKEKLATLKTTLAQFDKISSHFTENVTYQQYSQLIKPKLEAAETAVNLALKEFLDGIAGIAAARVIEELPAAIIHGRLPATPPSTSPQAKTTKKETDQQRESTMDDLLTTLQSSTSLSKNQA